MKISDNSPIRPTSSSSIRKKSGVSGSNFLDYLAEADAAAETGATNETSPIESVAPSSFDAMLALQEMPQGEIQRKKAVQRGFTALDQLESLRHSLLLGRVPAYMLRNMSNLLADQLAQTDDPRLREVIDEIELRAAVELAKLEMAQLQQQRTEALAPINNDG